LTEELAGGGAARLAVDRSAVNTGSWVRGFRGKAGWRQEDFAQVAKPVQM
jgi:hypothetical protein